LPQTIEPYSDRNRPNAGFSFIDNFRTPHSEKEHVVERYKISADGAMLEASVTVEDPDAFNAPLHMIKRWRKAANPGLETVCAENNGDHFREVRRILADRGISETVVEVQDERK
jgi:hypothetical protein